MQQHLMQMQPMMASYYSNNNITTDHIQQYLDENKALILKIVESQNTGKINECAENQAKLQRNLMYLASIADSQPQPPTMQSQYPNSSTMPPIGAHFMQHQQQQPQTMTPQELMAARSSMLYSQQPYAALQPQVGMGSGGVHILQGEPDTSAVGFSDHFGLATTSKQDAGTSAAADGSENLHLKSLHDGR